MVVPANLQITIGFLADLLWDLVTRTRPVPHGSPHPHPDCAGWDCNGSHGRHRGTYGLRN